MEEPVFYDASGRRNRWTMRGFLGLLLLTVLAAIAFAVTVVEVPVPQPLALAMEHPVPRPLEQQVLHLRHRAARGLSALRDNLASWLPRHTSPAAQQVRQIKAAFYVPWDDASRSSLSRHIGEIDWLIPSVMFVTGPAHTLTMAPDRRLDALLAATPHRPKLLPMVQNAVEDRWDGAGSAALFRDRAARTAFLDRLEQLLLARKADGVVFDFEEIPADALPAYMQFLREARARFAARQWQVVVTVPADDDDWNLRAFARVADKIVLMAYDEHSPEGDAGPIASQGWFVKQLGKALARVPREKLIVAIGNYAYDWTASGQATSLAVEEAWLNAHDSEAPIQFDRQSGNPSFGYEDGGATHSVWMLDAATAWNQLRVADLNGVAGVALWRLGTEDAGFWPALAAFESGHIPDLRTLHAVGNVDVEGNGEILRIEDVPAPGQRQLFRDARNLIVLERYVQLPTPFVVRRTGYKPGFVALSFDDGPSAEWTPKILDVLKSRGVPGTFFLIGENAMAHPLLVKRIVAQGSELGNHTFTHPNLAKVSPEGTRIELNATQRVVEAYTGRSLRLFRAPYFGDAEPTTADELIPALTAQQAGYTNVGLHVDPNDWQRPGTDAIVNQVIAQVEDGSDDRSAQIILLHDGGGDRSQTVAALPRIIDALRAKGYRFVPVSELAGLAPGQVMPPVSGVDLLSVRADIGMFLVLAALGYALKWMFFLAIALGVARAVILAALALNSARRRNRPVPPAIDPELFVSVLIPAFNEARVIEASVRRVLASTNTQVEVIVIDDGSTDETSAIVRAAFSQDDRVQLLTLQNGGKARALNRGLALAKGGIIIALDADTQFEEETIARLARWFADPRIGAVAGNAKVGNRINLVTRWQAVEYVTAQNLERRALSRFDAIMVVPGAVGAWRKAALDEVGGYPADTLAEDQDLTIAIQRRGWEIAYDVDAVAWTEAPESFRALAKQRFRWAYGTLQCLWKHRGILRLRRPAGLAYVGIPQAWIFQIGFALISPLIDLALVVSMISTAINVAQHGWAQTQSDVLRMAAYWIVFTAVDILCGWVAYRLERREKRYPFVLLVAQRFVYRQLMYGVVIRAVANALRGLWVGWGKLERSGRVDARS
ncbi:glycosyltransferase [Flavisphingomonas formosensis]|uniref:glycosyltransferase n=1 Tax=Flavisphingomonas formosensis TaxID=861534 RepID=UPI0012FB9151|nr:glycosyltransferase [Sphingomonas formosensis]